MRLLTLDTMFDHARVSKRVKLETGSGDRSVEGGVVNRAN